MTAQIPIRLAIRLSDPELAGQLASILKGVNSIALVEAEEADVEIRPAPKRDDIALTARERQVLAMMAEGASNREIGLRLGISAHTAKFHVRRITDKFDAVGRTDAVAVALQKEVIGL